ncbi:MAG: S1C family serine protease [Gemmatales bacterium]|nr:S1C family serine protease [Gemmatales bacterium]MDW8387133.1 trypsin-like peptidase domain-containing protein [Gemmatales bacterium]
MTKRFTTILALLVWCLTAPAALADVSFAEVVRKTNPKIVKVYGAGGFRGVTAYCSGVLISPDGYILTVYSPTLDTRELRVHLYDGTRHACELVAAEPQLDVALIRIKERERFKDLPLDYFDLSQPPPEVRVGDWVLAFSNLFEIATRDEPVSVQRGVVSAITPFAGRRGIHEAPYKGKAIIVDAITNNPGAHGGALTTRKGELIGLIGKELKNALSETWVNYAMPISELRDFALRAMRGEYKPVERPERTQTADKKPYHGIVLIPDILDRTPPYVEEVVPGSPAARAGLRPDDLIVFIRAPRPDSPGEMEERVIASCKAFKETLAGLDPGMTIKVIVRRGGQLLSLDLTLEQNPVR